MKYCTHCGKEIEDEAVICTGCGCAVERSAKQFSTNTNSQTSVNQLVSTLSQKLKSVGVIWLIIGSIQFLYRIIVIFSYSFTYSPYYVLQILNRIITSFGNSTLVLLSIANIFIGVLLIASSKSVLKDSSGIVSRFNNNLFVIFALIFNIFGVFGFISMCLDNLYYGLTDILLLLFGVIGIIGPICYCVIVKGFINRNKGAFEKL